MIPPDFKSGGKKPGGPFDTKARILSELMEYLSGKDVEDLKARFAPKAKLPAPPAPGQEEPEPGMPDESKEPSVEELLAALKAHGGE